LEQGRGASKGETMNSMLGSLREGQDYSIDPDVFEQLKEDYGKLIGYFAKKAWARFNFRSQGIEPADLMQCGYILLIIAHKNFDPVAYGTKFHTFLARFLINAFKSIIEKKHIPILFQAPGKHNTKKNDGEEKDFMNSLQQPEDKALCGLRLDLKNCIQSLYEGEEITIEEVQILNMKKAGFTLKEIGAKMGCSNEWVNVLFHRLVEKIQRRHRLLTHDEVNTDK
jgi:RNA polymerase sigma factor (sigma-70 family)